MKFPIVVTDFDGTFRRSDRTVSDYTRRVVRAFVARGGIFCIATGRATEGIRSQLERIGLAELDFPLISCQGARCEMTRSDTVLYDAPLDTAIATELMDYCIRRGRIVQTYWDGAVYASARHPRYAEYCAANGIEGYVTPTLIDDARGRTLYKVLLWIDEQDRAFERELEQRFGTRCKLRRSGDVLVDAFSVEAGKDKALNVLALHYGCTLADCMAFGDQANDADMLIAAGMGIAMGNAVPALKAVADAVADTCDHDGVARWMNEVLCLGISE